MKMFEFPYLVCPSEDEIVNRLDANGVKMEDEWEHWDLYEKL